MKSLSDLRFAMACASHSCPTLSSTFSGVALTSERMITVLSLPTITLLAWPKSAKLIWLRSSPVFSEKYVAPTDTARSCISSCCLYPKLGGGTVHIFRPFFITLAAMVFTTLLLHGATISSFLPSCMIGFSTFSICKMLWMSTSATSIITSSNTHSSFF